MNIHFFTTTHDFILSQFCHKSAVGNIFWQLGTNPLWKNCENAILSLKEEDVIAPVLLREAHRFFHQPMWPSGNKKVLVHLYITNSHFYVSLASLLLFSIHLLIAIQTARLRLMNLLFPGQKRSIFLYGICFWFCCFKSFLHIQTVRFIVKWES